MNWKRPLALSLAALTLGGTLAACGSQPSASTPTPSAVPAAESPLVSSSELKAPKYVFLFIGDGMSYPQIQSTNYYGVGNDVGGTTNTLDYTWTIEKASQEITLTDQRGEGTNLPTDGNGSVSVSLTDAPFVVEGMLLGLTGALVAFFAQWGVYQLVAKFIVQGNGLSLVTVVSYGSIAGTILIVFCATGALIGVGGSLLAIRKFLQV